MTVIIAKLTEDSCRAKVGSTWVVDGVAANISGSDFPSDTDLLVRAYTCAVSGTIRAPGRTVEIYCDVLSMRPGAAIDVSGPDNGGTRGGTVEIIARRLEGQLVVHADGHKGSTGSKGSKGPQGNRGPDGASGNLGTWGQASHPHAQGQPGGNGGIGGTGGKGGTGGDGGRGGDVHLAFFEAPPPGAISVTVAGGAGGDGGDGGDGGEGGDPGSGGQLIECCQVML